MEEKLDRTTSVQSSEAVEDSGGPEDAQLDLHASFGCDFAGGFNEFSNAYKSEPTLRNYLKLRREHPEAEIEIAIGGGIEALIHLAPEFKKHGMDPKLIAGVLDADPDAISEVSLQLIDSILKAEDLTRAGETHLASRSIVIPDKLINWFISTALDALSWNDFLYIPRDLIVLIRSRIGAQSQEYETEIRTNLLRSNAAFIAAQLLARGEKPSYRKLAEILGVAPSTVMRWFKPGELSQKIEIFARGMDDDGNFKLMGEPLREK